MARQADAEAERIITALYRAEVRYQDGRLGELLGNLDLMADLDDTLVNITADHGENINDDGRWDHEYAVNDTLIHVPLIIRYPKLFRAGTRVPGLCQLDALLPTVRDVVEGEGAPSSTSVRSLVPNRFTPREEVFTQMYPLYTDFKNLLARDAINRDGLLKNLHSHWRVVRTRDWKYIHSSDGQHQLYDMRVDSEESTDLGDASQAARLRDRLSEWWAAQPQYVPESSAALSPSAGSVDLDDLRKLGYVSDH
jgi:arylsulfatase A-like enzyme